MPERTPRKDLQSLDALLSANREQFDSLFERQMKAAPPPLVPARRVRAGPGAASRPTIAAPEPSQASGLASAAPTRSPRADIRAELNRRFTIFWSSELLEQEIQNERAIVRCRLKVGDDSRVETGSSRIDGDADHEAALQRAYDAALQKCADHLAASRDADNAVLVPSAPVSAEPGPAEQARQAAARARPIDAITLDRLQTALINTCQEMATVCGYSMPSRSPRDGHPDPLALVTDAHGRMLAGGFGSYVAHLLQQRELRWAPGDVLLQSDPYLSAGTAAHATEWLVLMPVFADAELIGFTSMAARVADVGGSMAGSVPVQARTAFSEGVRVPPIKIVAGGLLNEAALELILNNSRTPQENRADLLAMVAGCRAGSVQLTRLRERFGGARYRQACAAMLDRTRQMLCALIRERIPEEPQSFQDQVDDDGCGNGPFKLKLTVWREGDHAYFDWTGTSEQAPGPINLALHVGLAKMFAGRVLARDLDQSLLSNDGFHELIHVTLPKGTILNPRFPASTGRREQVLARHLEVLAGALERHRPAMLRPAGFAMAPALRFAGIDASGVPFELTEAIQVGPCGRLRADGTAAATSGSDPASDSVEQLERDFPVVIESCASIAASGGAGLDPGVNGIEKVYRVTTAGELTIHDDRHASRPWGVNGGKAGAASAKWIVRADGTRATLPSKVDRLALGPGDRIVFRTAGAGGSGDPLLRDPELVRRDVRAGRLTLDSAAAEYGVVMSGVVMSGVVMSGAVTGGAATAGVAPSGALPSGTRLEVDARATRELRERLMRQRKAPDLFDYGDAP